MTRVIAPVDSYHASVFLALDGDRELGVRIGEHSTELDDLLARFGATRGVFITGWNPLSQLRPDDENRAANVRMRHFFKEHGFTVLPHIGRSEREDWEETGFFVLEMNNPDALRLAGEFGQFAIVTVERGQPAALGLTRLAYRDGAEAAPGSGE